MSTVRQALKKAMAVLSALVMLEIIIMISPFALYWYSLYSPTLQALHRWRGTAWLGSFILPHSVITTSAWLEGFRWWVGPYLFSLGLLAFFALAAQVYTAKFRRRGLVQRGVYRHIRHPQYLSLGIAGLGLLTHWPRMIIVVFYLLMLTAYYTLAQAEERRLLQQVSRIRRLHEADRHVHPRQSGPQALPLGLRVEPPTRPWRDAWRSWRSPQVRSWSVLPSARTRFIARKPW